MSFIRLLIAAVFAIASRAAPVNDPLQPSGIIVTAEPNNLSVFPYVPEESMRELCQELRKKQIFRCTSVWESGAIGVFTNMQEPDWNALALELHQAIDKYIANTRIGFLARFTWRVDKGASLYPVETPDGRYVWYVDETCARRHNQQDSGTNSEEMSNDMPGAATNIPSMAPASAPSPD